jgi:hypothetical protein
VRPSRNDLASAPRAASPTSSATARSRSSTREGDYLSARRYVEVHLVPVPTRRTSFSKRIGHAKRVEHPESMEGRSGGEVCIEVIERPPDGCPTGSGPAERTEDGRFSVHQQVGNIVIRYAASSSERQTPPPVSSVQPAEPDIPGGDNQSVSTRCCVPSINSRAASR